MWVEDKYAASCAKCTVDFRYVRLAPESNYEEEHFFVFVPPLTSDGAIIIIIMGGAARSSGDTIVGAVARFSAPIAAPASSVCLPTLATRRPSAPAARATCMYPSPTLFLFIYK